MSKYRVRFEPQSVECRVEEGTTLYQAALDAGLRVQTLCGGEGKCGRCKVEIREGRARSNPHPFLTQDEIDAGLCLACLTPVEGDLGVHVPPEMEIRSTAETQTLLSSEGIRRTAALLGEDDLQPWARWVEIDVDLEKAADAGSDSEAVERGLRNRGAGERIHLPVAVLRKLARTVPERERSVAFLIQEYQGETRVLDVSTDIGDRADYGFAVDLGTTVVAGALVDMSSGEVVAEGSAENLQSAHGADIIHRISFATRKGGLQKLQQLAAETVDGIVGDLLAGTGNPRTSVCAVTVAGNTTMSHLFLGLDPTYIRESPFVPTARRVELVEAATVGIGIHPSAPAWISPAVANYLGGDVTAGVLLTGMWDEDPLTLYLDLGTNGEMVLGNREWLAGCACSCGPAFEGSGVTCGMRAASGAIERIRIDPKTFEPAFDVIGDESPRGVCGSALVDLVAELRRVGLLNSKGKLSSESSDRIVPVRGGKGYVIVPEGETARGEHIVITERDLEHLIRSKGAAFAGVRTLLRNLDIPPDRIERVVIAGGFGRSLDVENAVYIGMLPDLPRDRFSYIGNGSLQGAVAALLWKGLRDRIEEIAQRVTYVDLSTTPGYMDEFIASLFLPHTDLSLFPSVRSS